MKEPRKASREEAVAEIQARLEMCEEDLDSDRRMAEVSEETQEIERLLEDLMEGDESEPGYHSEEVRSTGIPEVDALFREEEEEATRLAETEEARRKRPPGGAEHGSN